VCRTVGESGRVVQEVCGVQNLDSRAFLEPSPFLKQHLLIDPSRREATESDTTGRPIHRSVISTGGKSAKARQYLQVLAREEAHHR